MPRTRALPALVLTVAAVAVATATGCGGAPSAPPAGAGTVADFVSLATRGIGVDYTPLASPRQAVDTADLVVEGTLAGVADGIGLTYPDARLTERKAGAYATFVVAVDRVISGDPAAVRDGRVYVTVRRSRAAQVEELAAANPRPRTVAVLDDITSWRPAPGVQVARPATVPAGAPLFAPYDDGLWLQGPGEPTMLGLYAAPGDLAAAWGRPTTVNALSAALQRAA